MAASTTTTATMSSSTTTTTKTSESKSSSIASLPPFVAAFLLLRTNMKSAESERKFKKLWERLVGLNIAILKTLEYAKDRPTVAQQARYITNCGSLFTVSDVTCLLREARRFEKKSKGYAVQIESIVAHVQQGFRWATNNLNNIPDCNSSWTMQSIAELITPPCDGDCTSIKTQIIYTQF